MFCSSCKKVSASLLYNHQTIEQSRALLYLLRLAIVSFCSSDLLCPFLKSFEFVSKTFVVFLHPQALFYHFLYY